MLDREKTFPSDKRDKAMIENHLWSVKKKLYRFGLIMKMLLVNRFKKYLYILSKAVQECWGFDWRKTGVFSTGEKRDLTTGGFFWFCVESLLKFYIAEIGAFCKQLLKWGKKYKLGFYWWWWKWLNAVVWEAVEVYYFSLLGIV